MESTSVITERKNNKAGFEPRIVAFLCTWCSYAGADLAGTSRLHYPPNVMPIRVMCSGRVDAEFIIQAFREGADAVAVFGCHPGDCHYINGNHKTMGRIPILKKMLAQFGIEPERLQLHWVSASEGPRFAEIVTNMTAQIRELGPLELEICDPK
ncbi:MAG TPA: hydrogenase iron-sulfur subunit [Firmicutes bacterium]|nr:hydrogenase iron-sulfur subunit [Bacillota bacterium]